MPGGSESGSLVYLRSSSASISLQMCSGRIGTARLFMIGEGCLTVISTV